MVHQCPSTQLQSLCPCQRRAMAKEEFNTFVLIPAAAAVIIVWEIQFPRMLPYATVSRNNKHNCAYPRTPFIRGPNHPRYTVGVSLVHILKLFKFSHKFDILLTVVLITGNSNALKAATVRKLCNIAKKMFETNDLIIWLKTLKILPI